MKPLIQKTLVRLPLGTYQRVRGLAFSKGVSQSDVISDILEFYFDNFQEEAQEIMADSYPQVQGKGYKKGLTLEQLAELYHKVKDAEEEKEQ